MSTKPTRTTNRLHFTDLDPIRFEDLCLALIFPLHPWVDIRHYGRVGSDSGVDIYAKEQVEDGAEREWYVQCRRYRQATISTLKKAVEDALSRATTIPDVLLLVIACDVRRNTHEAYVGYASKKGVSTPLLWTASMLEARLYAERKDLLFSFFGVSQAAEARRLESTKVRNISIKKRLYKELSKKANEYDFKKARKDPSIKFKASEVIIHSIDDSTYPDVDTGQSGISGWFKLEIWDFYHNGLEFAARVENAIVDSKGKWAIIEHGQVFDEKKYKMVRVFRILRIPYRNIVDFDVIGDEYYPQPHLYCRFADSGEPYEGSRYVLIDSDYPWPMDANDRFDFDARK